MPAPPETRAETPEEAIERKEAFRKAAGIEKAPGGGFGSGTAEPLEDGEDQKGD